MMAERGEELRNEGSEQGVGPKGVKTTVRGRNPPCEDAYVSHSKGVWNVRYCMLGR